MIKDFEKAIELAPDHPTGYLGRVYAPDAGPV